MMTEYLRPEALRRGDKVAIISPASAIKVEYVDALAEELTTRGYVPEIMPHAKGVSGTYSGTIDEREADLREALLNPDVKAIICARGGYGAVHLADRFSAEFLRDHAKWIVGFSDISILHAMMHRAGVMSIHGPMAKDIAMCEGANEELRVSREHLFEILEGNYPAYTLAPHKYNVCGTATGTLVGGNMIVLGALAGSKWNLLKPDSILFIEDVGEAVYKIERVMYMLRLNGVLDNIRGLIIGQFTEYKVDTRNNQTMYDMLHELLADAPFPVAYDFPCGHIDHNLPLIESSRVTLEVTPERVALKPVE